MTVVRCAQCQSALTRDLLWVPPMAINRSPKPAEPVVLPGSITRDPDAVIDLVHYPDGRTCLEERHPPGCLVIAPDDVLPEALSVTDEAAGCCGLDGMDGPNQRCRCGSVVGTARTDCWTEAEVRFIPEAVRPHPNEDLPTA